MQHTQFSQLKKAAADLCWFTECDDLPTLLKYAMDSEDCKDFDTDETREYCHAIHSAFIFLKELTLLFGYNTMSFPSKFNSRTEFLHQKFESTTPYQVTNLMATLFDDVPARKLVFDLYSVFTSALTNKEFLKDTLNVANISFGLKLLTQFIRDYELMASFNVQEKICTNLEGFMPVNRN